MTFRTTVRADQDIVDLYVDGAQQFGIDMAERYHEGLMSLLELLGSNPRMDRLRQEFTPPVRMHAYRSHQVVYVEDGPGVLIVRVLHSRQDWQTVLN